MFEFDSSSTNFSVVIVNTEETGTGKIRFISNLQNLLLNNIGTFK